MCSWIHYFLYICPWYFWSPLFFLQVFPLLFLKVLILSLLTLFGLFPLLRLGFCNQCNLACFLTPNNFAHSSSNRVRTQEYQHLNYHKRCVSEHSINVRLHIRKPCNRNVIMSLLFGLNESLLGLREGCLRAVRFGAVTTPHVNIDCLNRIELLTVKWGCPVFTDNKPFRWNIYIPQGALYVIRV